MGVAVLHTVLCGEAEAKELAEDEAAPLGEKEVKTVGLALAESSAPLLDAATETETVPQLEPVAELLAGADKVPLLVPLPVGVAVLIDDAVDRPEALPVALLVPETGAEGDSEAEPHTVKVGDPQAVAEGEEVLLPVEMLLLVAAELRELAPVDEDVAVLAAVAVPKAEPVARGLAVGAAEALDTGEPLVRGEVVPELTPVAVLLPVADPLRKLVPEANDVPVFKGVAEAVPV